ncbi:MAG: DUF1588 domain-containing protein [Myxococcota bacterium]
MRTGRGVLGLAGPVCAVLVGGCYVGGGVAAGEGETGDESGLETEASGEGESDDDGGDDGPGEPSCDGPLVGPTRMARLTQEEYANAVFDLLGVAVDPRELSGDEHVGPFDANVASGVGTLQLREYLEMAEHVAQLAEIDGASGCPEGAAGTDCAAEFVATLAHRAYGRPLTDAQRQQLDAVFAAGLQDDVPTAVSLSITAILQNPYFLYGVQTGEPDPDQPGVIRLDGASIARRMALLLWGSVADDALLEAAEADGLRDPEVRRAQAERMLSDGRAERAVGRRYAEWFGVADLDVRPKDAEVFVGYDAALAQDMERAVSTFAARTILDGGTLDDLLLSRRAFVSPALAALYGVTVDADADETEVELDADERAGLLTRAAVMTRWSHEDQTAPVQRGAFVRADVMCQPNPPPPPDVDDAPVAIDPDATARERFAMHREDPSCNACHERLDLLGFGFEHYDGVGRYRTIDGNVGVDARGSLLYADVEGDFEGGVELSAMLAESDEVRRCFVRQHVRLSQLREIIGAEPAAVCLVEALIEQLPTDSLPLRDLLVATVAHESFGLRIIEEEEGS